MGNHGIENHLVAGAVARVQSCAGAKADHHALLEAADRLAPSIPALKFPVSQSAACSSQGSSPYAQRATSGR